jgi:hypothetical protein
MREDLELETLEDRRLSLRLILMYKVVVLRNLHARHCLADGSNELQCPQRKNVGTAGS